MTLMWRQWNYCSANLIIIMYGKIGSGALDNLFKTTKKSKLQIPKLLFVLSKSLRRCLDICMYTIIRNFWNLDASCRKIKPLGLTHPIVCGLYHRHNLASNIKQVLLIGFTELQIPLKFLLYSKSLTPRMLTISRFWLRTMDRTRWVFKIVRLYYLFQIFNTFNYKQ